MGNRQWTKKYSKESHCIGHPIILMLLIVLILATGTAGCKQPDSSLTGQTTSIIATTGQTTTLQTSANSPTSFPTTEQHTTTSNQTVIKAPFSQEDLTINGVLVGATPQQAEKTLGVPKESKTGKDMITDFDILTYTYEGLKLIFVNSSKADKQFQLKYVEVTGPDYVLARGLKVSDPAQKAFQRFSNEENESKYQGYTVLYGDPAELDRQDQKDELAFAYYNNETARFVHMTPPYMSEYATIYDEMAVLNLTIENQIITKIFWMLGAGAE